MVKQIIAMANIVENIYGQERIVGNKTHADDTCHGALSPWFPVISSQTASSDTLAKIAGRELFPYSLQAMARVVFTSHIHQHLVLT